MTKLLSKYPLSKTRDIFLRNHLSSDLPRHNDFKGFSFFHFLRNGTINAHVIDRLKKGSTLFSVGSGIASLERSLVRRGVLKENIVLSDINVRDSVKKLGFKTYEFDVFNPWPNTGKFDYIVFPESLAVAMGFHIRQNQSNPREILFDVLRNALLRLNPNGEIRISNFILKNHNDLKIIYSRLRRQFKSIKFSFGKSSRVLIVSI